MPRLTVKEAAQYCRCHPGTLNRLRVQGRGPAWSKPFGRVFYDTADLDRWLEASRRDPGKAITPWEAEGISKRTWYRRQGQKSA